jgi:transcription antitermination factor NusG
LLSAESNAWFVVQVAPQHEHKVATVLSYKGQEHFLPTVTLERRWSDRIKHIQVPLFPGYVFCKTRRSDVGAVLHTPGVRRVICFGGRPQSVPNDEIEALQRVSLCGRAITPTPYPIVGQKVRIASGPLMGVSGLVVRMKNQHRLIVSVELIMRSVFVEVGFCEIGM